MFTLLAWSMTFFFVSNLFAVCLAMTWKVRIWSTLYDEEVISDYFLFSSYLVIQFWYSFQRLQHGRSKDYIIPLIYFSVTKISKLNSKYKLHQQIIAAQEFTFTACFEKGMKLKIFFCQFSSLSFPILLFFWVNWLFLSLYQSLTAFKLYFSKNVFNEGPNTLFLNQHAR